jgi:hypothetical protein
MFQLLAPSVGNDKSSTMDSFIVIISPHSISPHQGITDRQTPNAVTWRHSRMESEAHAQSHYGSGIPIAWEVVNERTMWLSKLNVSKLARNHHRSSCCGPSFMCKLPLHERLQLKE